MTYPLLPFQRYILSLLKYDNQAYWYGAKIRIDKGFDWQEIKKVLEKTLTHHPIFSIDIDENGQRQIIRQDILKGPFHSFEIHTDENYIFLDLRFNRILFDGYSISVLAESIIRSLNNIVLEEDHYIDFLDQLNTYYHSEKSLIDKDSLTSLFGRINFPVHPQTDLPLETSISLSGQYYDDLGNLSNNIFRLSNEQRLTIDGIISLGAALAIMDYNNTSKAALTWAYDGRETQDSYKIMGSLHRDIPILIELPQRGNERQIKENLFSQTRKSIRFGIAHSRYPLTLIPPYNQTWDYAVNIIRTASFKQMKQMLPLPSGIEIENIVFPKNNYSLLDINYIVEGKRLSLNYYYSASHYKEESIVRYAQTLKNKLQWLCQ